MKFGTVAMLAGLAAALAVWLASIAFTLRWWPFDA